MKTRLVSIERKGILVPVGFLSGEKNEGQFVYAPEYRNAPDSHPISVHLPLQKEPFSKEDTACFFEGLLPEGFLRRSIAEKMHVSEADYLELIDRLGDECMGAIRIHGPEKEEAQEEYVPLSLKRVRALAAEGANESAEVLMQTHLSLTGASGKVGLYFDEEKGKWYLPHGSAPSTHIVKQSHVRLDGIVLNEQLVLCTASRLGIETPQSFIVNVGEGKDQEVLLATKRYDRIPGDRMILGRMRPWRLHQEDMAQAMGVPARAKYEPEGATYLSGVARILQTQSADPLADLIALWDVLVFDVLIGNTDHHLKNISILYHEDLHTFRLAPAYDLLCTVIYKESTRDLAFSMGGERSIDEVGPDALRKAAEEVGIGRGIAMDRADRLRENWRKALKEATEELYAQGFTGAEQMRKRILESRKHV